MAFDFDIRYIKGNAIPHVDVLSRLHFKRGQKDSILENMEYEFLHCIDTIKSTWPQKHYRVQY